MAGVRGPLFWLAGSIGMPPAEASPRGVRTGVLWFLPAVGISAALVVGGSVVLTPIAATGAAGASAGPTSPIQTGASGADTTVLAVLNGVSASGVIELSPVGASGSDSPLTPRGFRSPLMPWAIVTIGAPRTQASAQVVLSEIGASGSGRVLVSGAGAGTLSPLVTTGAAAGGATGSTGPTPLGSLIATGEAVSGARGSAALVALDGVRASGAGRIAVTASGVAHLGAITGAATSQVPVTAQGAIMLGSVIASGGLYADGYADAAIDLGAIRVYGAAKVGSGSVAGLNASGGLHRRRYRSRIKARGF